MSGNAQATATERDEMGLARVAKDVMRDAKIVASLTDENMGEYFTRLLRPLVARDKAEAMRREAEKT